MYVGGEVVCMGGGREGRARRGLITEGLCAHRFKVWLCGEGQECAIGGAAVAVHSAVLHHAAIWRACSIANVWLRSEQALYPSISVVW